MGRRMTKVGSWVASFIEAIRLELNAPNRAWPIDPWRTFANERGFVLPGVGSARSRRTMTGLVGGVAMRIEIGAIAKVSAQISSVIAGKMCAYSDNTLVDVVTIASEALPDVGDEDFDAHFFLRGKDPRVAEELLTVDVRQALMRFSQGICLDYDDGKISLTWSLEGVDARTVDAACAIVLAASNTHPSAGAYR